MSKPNEPMMTDAEIIRRYHEIDDRDKKRYYRAWYMSYDEIRQVLFHGSHTMEKAAIVVLIVELLNTAGISLLHDVYDKLAMCQKTNDYQCLKHGIINRYGAEIERILDERNEPKFKIGDEVICNGKEYTIAKINRPDNYRIEYALAHRELEDISEVDEGMLCATARELEATS